MARPKDLYKTTRDPNNKKLPKSKKRKRPKGSKGNGWGFVGAAAALAASLAFAAFGFRRRQKQSSISEQHLLTSMLLRPMVFTEHGNCRMDCRHIPSHEVREVLAKGSINHWKSNPSEAPCPKYVIDAQVGSNRKNVQGVFSACQDATRLVTVIDKDQDWECYCP